MARIESYALTNNVKLGDKWIGSKAVTGATKNFSVEEVLDFINSASAVDSQTLRYTFQYVENSNIVRQKGSISFDPPTGMSFGDPIPVPLDSALLADPGFLLSDYSLKYLSQGIPTDIGSFYPELVDSIVFISNTKDITTFGVYTWESAVPNTNTEEPDFYRIKLNVIQSQGDFEEGEEYFISLLSWNPTVTGGDKTFVFDQGIPSVVWDVTHNLNKFCSVTVVNSFKEQVYGRVDYINKNRLTITFNATFSGQAFCN